MNKLAIFFSLVWRNWYYRGVDKWHLWKHRISAKTAWEVANILGEKNE